MITAPSDVHELDGVQRSDSTSDGAIAVKVLVDGVVVLVG
jgi:hypothetical protein